ncbi:MAG: hypothetical protein RL369_1139 [Pseudomonadota bacterium]
MLASASVAADMGRSLSLQQAVSTAIERNHDLQLARTTVATARANLLSADAAPNPTLGISTGSIQLSGANRGGALWRKEIDTIVGINQLIERGDKRALRAESARFGLDAANHDLRDVRRQLRLLVAHAYADLHAAQDRVIAAQDGAQLLDTALVAAQIRRDAGDIAGADVERVRVEALRAQNDVTTALETRRRAQQLLAFLLAEPDSAGLLQAADAWPSPDEIALPDRTAILHMIDKRADVLAASARIDRALAGAKLAESLRTRDVAVGVQYEHYPQPGTNPNGNSIGVSVQLPLFTRHYYQGEIGASIAALDAARTQHERVRAVAETEINSAALAIISAAERLRRYRDELIQAAETSARATEYAYQNGAVGVMDLIDARRTLRTTRLDALTAQADFSKALASWRAASETTEQEMK